ncbi:MAG: aldo/keto reductase [Armatimonadota bacterium]
MQYRILGKTGLEVSIIGFGGIKLPAVDEQKATRALNRALDLGVNFVDTARNYRDSEAKIGRALKSRRGEYVLATKSSKRDAASAMADLETSLRELQTDAVDLWQLHTVSDPETWAQVTAPGGAVEACQKALQQGKARHVGVTIHRAHDVMRQAIRSGLFETIMVAYSPLDQEGVAAEILPMAKDHGLGVIIMKPLSGGALSLPERPADGPDPIAIGSLKHIVSNEAVTVAIPGITCVREIEEDAAVGDEALPVTREETDRLMRRIGALRKEFRYGQVCLQCGYCQPCPEGVPIPDVFRATDMYRQYPDNLKHMGLNIFQALEVGPDACAECGQCEEACPAGLPVREKLKEARQLFSTVT